MDIKIILASIAGILAILGNVPYIKDMLSGKIQPHPYTWLVWSIVSGVTFVGQVTQGAGWATIPFAISELFTISIFFFSIRYGFKNIPNHDKYFLYLALLGIVPWIITKDPTVSVIIMVTIDIIAFIPTLRKAWVLPRSESPVLYISNVLRHSLALASLNLYNIPTMLHSISMIFTNTIMTSFLYRKRRK